MHWLAVLLLIAQLIFTAAPFPLAQSSPTITDLGAKPDFGESVTFRVRVEPVSDVQELLVFITPQGQPTVWQKFDLEKATSQGQLILDVDARQLSLYPFSKVTYRYEATLKNGSKVKSDNESFQYNDTRFEWQTLESGIFEIYWYGNDSTIGQMIADIAKEGLEASQAILSVTPPAPLRIYAYTSSRDLQSALQMTSQPWVAGHTTPELSMVLISVPTGPEKKLELQRQVPHEIMHILQYQVMGGNFSRQPVWLLEGMASLVEIYPNPEYRTVLESSAQANSLIPFSSLCSTFPRDASGAFQAYAQSESFARFLYANYGSSGLRDLIDQYENGLGCEEGFAAAVGVPLNQAEYRWRQEELGINVGGLVLSNLSPYLLVGLLILVPASLAFLPLRAKKNIANRNA